MFQVLRPGRDDAGNLTSATPLFGARTGTFEPLAAVDGALLRPGEYLIGVGGLESAAYTLSAEPALRADAQTLVPGKIVAGALAKPATTVPLVIAPREGRQRWTLELFTPPAESVYAEILDANETSLMRRSGLREYGGLTFRDISLPAGTYSLKLTPSAAGGAFVARMTPEGPRVPARESEPNDSSSSAAPLPLGRPVGGRIGESGDLDMYAFEAPEGDALLDVRLATEGAPLNLCLQSADGPQLMCRDGQTIRLSPLRLRGKQWLTVSGSPDPDHAYELSIRRSGLLRPGLETEPNDRAELALPLAVETAQDGELVGRDVDSWRLVPEGAPRLWTLRARGSGLTELAVADKDGYQIVARTQAPAPSDILQLDEVYLPPAPYIVRVSGTDGSYTLAAEPGPAPDARIEREPNPEENPNRLQAGSFRMGRLADLDDRDVYRFSLAAPARIALTMTPPAGGAVDMEIEWGWPSLKRPRAAAAAGPVVYDAWLEPGDYLVRLRPSKPSPERYTLALAYADPFRLPADLEPNDSPSQAQPLPPSFYVEGRVGDFADADWYVLPVGAQDRNVEIALSKEFAAQVVDGAAEIPLTYNDDRSAFRFVIPAERTLKLGITGAGAYVLAAAIDGLAPAPRSIPPLPVSLDLALATKQVAAFWVRGQRIGGTLTLRNESDTAQEIALATRSSHVSYAPVLARSAVTLAPGATESVPVEIAIAADARSGIDAQIAVEAKGQDGARTSIVATVTATADARPVGEELVFAIPPEMRGGFNVASTALGGRPVSGTPDESDRDYAALFDGVIAEGFIRDASQSPITITRILGGDRAWPVAGITIHPQVGDRIAPAEQLRIFELLLSEDGVTFSPALSGSLSMMPVEQAFVLEAPVLARATQLRLLANHADNVGKIGLNEWMVVTTPGALEGASLNVADPDRGGSIAWSVPSFATPADAKAAILVEGGETAELRVPAGLRPTFVVGFRDGRAAEIVRLTWTNGKAPSSDRRFFSKVQVAASMDGPIGPWRDLGTVDVKTGPGGTAEMTMPPGTWARYVRFSAQDASKKEEYWLYPTLLAVYERPTDAAHLSILGEWGFVSREAAYETVHPFAPAPEPQAARSSRERPLPIALGAESSGIVRFDEKDDWYRLDTGANQGALTVRLANEPTIDVDLAVETLEGVPVPVRLAERGATEIVFEADVAPETAYLLRVHEPQRSVALAYDTSLSIAQFAPRVRQAIGAFADGVRQGQEFVNVMNFESPLLLEEWTDQPWPVQVAIAGNPAESGSSDVEATMIGLMTDMQRRRGARAIVIITDGDSTGHAKHREFWEKMASVRPRVFSGHLGIGSDVMGHAQFLQAIANANGGAYARAIAQADLDVVSERAAAWLRRPAAYRLAARIVPPQTRPPGTLSVSGADPPSAPGQQGPAAPESATEPDVHQGAVAIIMDASGSMLQRMDGRKRIDIAKTTLRDALQTALKPGMPVAVRVFGDDKAGSCNTRLAIPLSPLDVPAFERLLRSVQPKNRARTPIGASLRAVAGDLEGVKGRRTVVLVTDGEETCDGDPRTEIAGLRAQGFDVQVNIVGFAVEEGAVRDELAAWAAEGGGSYFDAGDAKELGAAMKQAMGAGFKVIDASGAVVASGAVNGEPVPLPPGIYQIEVGGRIVFQDVGVESAQNTGLVYAP